MSKSSKSVSCEVRETPTLLVPPHRFGSDASQDLSLQDFTAAAELLLQVPGVATWSGIRGTEFRHPLETHLQAIYGISWPFPVTFAGIFNDFNDVQ